ncbi:MAG: Lrp/AsnC family transcriptional regulator [Candidatus Helarchaeota archaeon]
MVNLKISNLRELDKKILLELIKDSNQSHKEIADTVSTSRQNISQRIKKLKKNGFINRFTIDLNTHDMDELKIKAYIFIREDPNKKSRQEIAKEIVKIPQVISFSRLYGRYSGIIEILVKDNEQANEIITKLHSLRGIIETETYFTRKIIKEDKNSPIIHLLTT